MTEMRLAPAMKAVAGVDDARGEAEFSHGGAGRADDGPQAADCLGEGDEEGGEVAEVEVGKHVVVGVRVDWFDVCSEICCALGECSRSWVG